jgi:hypothetical protein
MPFMEVGASGRIKKNVIQHKNIYFPPRILYEYQSDVTCIIKLVTNTHILSG